MNTYSYYSIDERQIVWDEDKNTEAGTETDTKADSEEKNKN